MLTAIHMWATGLNDIQNGKGIYKFQEWRRV